MTDYFKKLPTVYYDKVPAKNIMARADLTKLTRNNGFIFYPYTMEEGDRADMIAYNYYEDSDYTWLIHFSNDVVDPYYDLYISDENFQEFIRKKYGSLADANVNTKHYKNNWAQNIDQVINVSGYTALPSNLKKYWNPLIDESYRIISYKRKAVDWIVNTNRIIRLTTDPVETAFKFADLVSSGSATGTCVHANTTSITLQNITGAFTDASYQVNSRYSSVTANVTSMSILTQNLDAAEEVYYSPVSFLDFEEEQNQSRKEISLLDNRLANKASSELKKVMAE